MLEKTRDFLDEPLDIEAIWTQYRGRLRSFLASRVRDPADVDDLLQDILLQTHLRLDTVQDPKKLQSWLFQVARNATIDAWRRGGKDPMATELTGEEPAPEELEDYEKVRRHLATCVEPFLADLPEPYRRAVEAVDLHGASQKELAESLGISHSGMKARVQRGRAMLRQVFEQCCTYELDARGNIVGYERRSECDGCS